MSEFVLDEFSGIFCNKCNWFSTVGYEDENKDIVVQGLKFGYCYVLNRRMQECDYCSKAMRKYD